ncbi:MAG: glycosyltransferase family 2 protein [Pseudomonadota bacterium]
MTAPLPKISIVTPSYNQGRYLEETIISVINQKYPAVEHIIIDGGSSDNSVKIIKKYEKYLAYWISEPDKGQSDAINKGLAKCTGSFFNWLNSDDVLFENSLHNLAGTISANDCDVICGFLRHFGDLDKPDYRMFVGETTDETIVNHRMNQPATFYRLSVVNRLGGVNAGLQYAMDLELWFRYLIHYGIARVKMADYYIAQYRCHKESKTIAQAALCLQELNALTFSLAKESGLPEYILREVQPYKAGEGLSLNWSRCSKKGLRKLNSYYSKQYATLQYCEQNYTLARMAFANYLRTGAAYFNLSTLMIILKTFFRPKLLVHWYRKVKDLKKEK